MPGTTCPLGSVHKSFAEVTELLVKRSDIYIRIAAIHIPGSSLLLADIINLSLESLKNAIAGNGIKTNAIHIFKRKGLRAA